MRLSRFRRVQRLPGSAHPAVYEVALLLPMRRRARRPRHARRARLGAGRRRRPGLLQRDDGSPRVRRRRARRAGGRAASGADAGPGASSATRRSGHSPSSRRRSAWSRPQDGPHGPRRPLPGLRADVGERRLRRAPRHSVLLRPRGRRRRAGLPDASSVIGALAEAARCGRARDRRPAGWSPDRLGPPAPGIEPPSRACRSLGHGNKPPGWARPISGRRELSAPARLRARGAALLLDHCARLERLIGRRAPSSRERLEALIGRSSPEARPCALRGSPRRRPRWAALRDALARLVPPRTGRERPHRTGVTAKKITKPRRDRR